MPARTRRVLICSTKDQQPFAIDLAEHLEQSGLSAASLDNPEAAGWKGRQQEALADADSIVLLIGENPTAADRGEWKAVLETLWDHPEKNVVPILAPNAKLPPGFADLNFLEVSDQQGESAQLVPKVLAEIKGGARMKMDVSTDFSSTYAQRLDAIGGVSRSMGYEA